MVIMIITIISKIYKLMFCSPFIFCKNLQIREDNLLKWIYLYPASYGNKISLLITVSFFFYFVFFFLSFYFSINYYLRTKIMNVYQFDN